MKSVLSKKFSSNNCGSLLGVKSSRSEVLYKRDVLKYFANLIGKHLYQSLFFDKLAGQETQAQVFFCEIYEIFKNTFLYRTPQVAASVCVEFFIIFFADLRMSL